MIELHGMDAFTVFDCFCGFGGLSLGAELAGMTVIGGVDANPSAVEVFGKCFPDALAIQSNLLEEAPRTILKKAGICRGDVSVLTGGPPCQPYSINNHKRSTDDYRCGLVQRYLEFVSTLRPAWLLIENVPAFASIQSGKFFKGLLHSLRSRGYTADFGIFDATRFGVPQRRRRLMILACRDARKLKAAILRLGGMEADAVTVGDAFGDLPELASASAEYKAGAETKFQKMIRNNAPPKIQAHVAPVLGAKNLRRIAHVPAGGNWRNIPRHLLPSGMKRAKLTDHTTRYGRLENNQPAFTLLTKCDPHWGCFIHPNQDRIITVREAARLQSIPDRVPFPSGLTASYKLIGNAVPPMLAKGILETLQ